MAVTPADSSKYVKKVRFNSSMKVILIPSLVEYKDAGLSSIIWWNYSDYSNFCSEANRELNLLRAFENIDIATAKVLLYQPSKYDIKKCCIPKHAEQKQRFQEQSSLIGDNTACNSPSSTMRRIPRRGTFELLDISHGVYDEINSSSSNTSGVSSQQRSDNEGLLQGQAKDYEVLGQDYDDEEEDEDDLKDYDLIVTKLIANDNIARQQQSEHKRIPKLPSFLNDIFINSLQFDLGSYHDHSNSNSIIRSAAISGSSTRGNASYTKESSSSSIISSLQLPVNDNMDHSKKSPLGTLLAFASTFAVAAFALTEQG